MGGPRGPVGLGGGPGPCHGAVVTPGGLGGGPGGRPGGGPDPCPCPAAGVMDGCPCGPCGRGGPPPVLIMDRALSGIIAFGLTPCGRGGGGPGRGVGLLFGGPGTVLMTDRALSGGGIGRPGAPTLLRALSGGTMPGRGGGPRGAG